MSALIPQTGYAVAKPARVAWTWCGLWAAGAVVLAAVGAWWGAMACAALCASLACAGRAADRWAGRLMARCRGGAR